MKSLNLAVKRIICVFLIIVSAVSMCSAYVDFDSDFLVEGKDDTEKEKALNSITITCLEKMPEGYSITCFDVNENGHIAVVLNGYNGILVLDSNGEFMYGFKIKVYGSLYVEWGKECLNVICVRGNTVFSLDEKGNVLDIGTIATGNDLISVSTATTRIAGTEQYRLSNRGMGIVGFASGGYSKIERYNEYDETFVTIYDVSENTYGKVIMIAIGVFAYMGVISVIAFLSIRKIVRERRTRK